MTALYDLRFETGLCFRRLLPSRIFDGKSRVNVSYEIIGRLADPAGTPFLLHYREPGAASWWCAIPLGDSLRKKILGRLRTEVRQAKALPSWIVLHDLTTVDAQNLPEGTAQATNASQALLTDVWRARYLNDRDSDYVALKVPFAEKDAAKAAGAKWDPEHKVWRVKRVPDMTPFARWMLPPSVSTQPEPVSPVA